MGVPLAAGAEVFKGSLVINADGYGKPGNDSDTGFVVGIARDHVVNAGADGDEMVECERGIYLFNNAAGPVSVGIDCYVYDDDAVKTSSGKIRAGKIWDVEPDGRVWVDMRGI
jgi:hypothetical protein